MEKALEVLEKYCQWIAVGIGGLFLAWMLWSYVLLSPVTVPNGTSTVSSGDVDDTVAKNYANPLDEELKRTTIDTPPQVANVSPLESFMPLIKDGTDKPIVSLASSAFGSLPAKIELNNRGSEEFTTADPVTKLPTLPPSEITETFAKRVYHGEPPPPAPAPGQPQPPAVAPVAPVAGQIPPGKDLSYVRLSYRIPTDKISQSFIAEKVPAGAGSTTTVVAIKLMRQEQMPDGSWAEPTEVPYLKNNVWPYPLPKNAGEVTWFRSWSDSPQGQSDLLRPLFYPVIFGEGPWDPSMDEALPKFDAKAEQAKKQKEYEERQKAKKAAAPVAPTGPRAPSRRG
ncbi:MAG: hypothetical protein JWM57_4331, partial [Phycisphaerales bacterium]|nr:hypothetical protein [Phycisphaerales bacterium]